MYTLPQKKLFSNIKQIVTGMLKRKIKQILVYRYKKLIGITWCRANYFLIYCLQRYIQTETNKMEVFSKRMTLKLNNSY